MADLSYDQKTWKGGDAVTPSALNNIEQGIADTVTAVNTNKTSILSLQTESENADSQLMNEGVVFPTIGTLTNYTDSDGVYHKNLGVVDLGTLTWTYDSTNKRFSTSGIASLILNEFSPNIISCKKLTPSTSPIGGAEVDNTICPYSNGSIYVRCYSYTDASAFKSAMSGVYLYYELATPTTQYDKSAILSLNNNLAKSHNSIYRGKDITALFDSGEFSTQVSNGTFDDIYIGDYITKSYTIDGTTYTEDFVVADIDYHLHHGDTETTSHHVLMVMKNGSSATFQMNSTNVATGGYTGSDMWNTTIPKFATAIQNAFGSAHILSHRELLTNGISTSGNSMVGAGFTGYASGWTWFDVLFNIMNNAMRFGILATSSSFYDVGDCTKQLALFQLDSASKIAHKGKGGARYWDWLRDVASSTRFADCDYDGHSVPPNANSTGVVRGYFLLK